jgi:MoxR-like ATPase
VVTREEVAAEVDLVQRATATRARITAEVAKLIVGQKDVVEQLLVALFAGGHGLLIGVPGLAKTTLVSTVAHCLDLAFSRIQFTPDLMPSDVTGTEVLEEDRATGKRTFRFARGPVFTNLLLADEINRTPPKTQAALLEAMQERKVTVAGTTYVLDSPFLVFATQNPIEQEGTYPLPEAQLDRFMLAIRVGYPDLEEEVEVVRQTTGPAFEPVMKVLSPTQVLELQSIVRRVPTADFVVREAVDLVRRTRPGDERSPQDVKDFVAWGAGPRAAQHLVLAAKAFALLRGEFTVTPDHVRALAVPVLAHRVVVNFHAEAERVTAVDLVRRLVRA